MEELRLPAGPEANVQGNKENLGAILLELSAAAYALTGLFLLFKACVWLCAEYWVLQMFHVCAYELSLYLCICLPWCVLCAFCARCGARCRLCRLAFHPLVMFFLCLVSGVVVGAPTGLLSFQQHRIEKGDYRRRMRECVRATTAAPSYFTPLIDGPMMYADGAFMANNPTSIALTEVRGGGAAGMDMISVGIIIRLL